MLIDANGHTAINRVKQTEFWDEGVENQFMGLGAYTAVTNGILNTYCYTECVSKYSLATSSVLSMVCFSVCRVSFFMPNECDGRTTSWTVEYFYRDSDSVCDSVWLIERKKKKKRKNVAHSFVENYSNCPFFVITKIGPHFNGILWPLLMHSYFSTKKRKKTNQTPNNGPYVLEQYVHMNTQVANDALHICVSGAKHVAIVFAHRIHAHSWNNELSKRFVLYL